MKNIFKTYALKRCVWFLLNHHPTPQYFLHLSKKLLFTIVISSHMHGRKTIMASFEEFISVKLCIPLLNMAFIANVQENAILVLSLGGACAHFFNLPAPLWGVYSCSKKRKDKCLERGGWGWACLELTEP